MAGRLKIYNPSTNQWEYVGLGPLPAGWMVLTAAGGWPSTTGGCTTNAKVEFATNDLDMYVLAFDGATNQYAQWTIGYPSDWNGGTITAIPVWYCPSGGSAGQTCIWDVQGRAFGDGDAIDQAFGTAQASSDTWTADATIFFGPETPAITLAGTPAGGELAQIRIYRDATTDTLTSSVMLVALILKFNRA